MVRSRWKLMAGVLGLSIGGLAAVAGAGVTPKTAKRCPDPVPLGIPMIPTPVAGQVVPVPVLEAPFATPAQLPSIPSVSTPGEVPSLPLITVAGSMAEVAPMPRAGSVRVVSLVVSLNAEEPVRAIPSPAGVTAQPTPMSLLDASKPVVPTPAPMRPSQPGFHVGIGYSSNEPEPVSGEVLLPSKPTPVVPAKSPVTPQSNRPTPMILGAYGNVSPPEPPPISSEPLLPSQPMPVLLTPTPQVAPPTQTAAPTPTVSSEPWAPPMHEKKLKVMLHMGDERPRFEIRDGEETYLKVVCDKVDVKSPTEKGDTTSTMKASGKVAFITPGGDGVCDELTVMPGSGMVVVSGKVTFRYTWGKAETTVSGDRMTFRLGNTPGQTVLGQATIPASFTPRP